MQRVNVPFMRFECVTGPLKSCLRNDTPPAPTAVFFLTLKVTEAAGTQLQLASD